MQAPGAVGAGKLLGARGHFSLVPGEAVHRHADAAHLDEDVLATAQLVDMGAPLGHHLVEAIDVGAGPDRYAEVVEDDRSARKGSGQVGNLGNLGVEQDRVEAQLHRRQLREALPEGSVEIEARVVTGAAEIPVPVGTVPDSAKPLRTGG